MAMLFRALRSFRQTGGSPNGIPHQRQISHVLNFATVRNRTAPPPPRWHGGYMARKNTKRESGEATCAMVREEMAKPRMAKSARTAVLKLDTSRIRLRAVRKVTKAISGQ